MNINQAIVAVMKEIGGVGKDKENPQGWKYRSAEQVYNRISPLLAKVGVFSAPEVIGMDLREVATVSGKAQVHAILTVKFTFYSEDGSNVAVTTVGEAINSGDKACGAAQTYAHKIAINQLFAIPYDIIDPDEFSPVVMAKQHAYESALNDLKLAWVKNQNGKLTPDMSREELAVKFQDWTESIVGEQIESLEHVDQCRDALKETHLTEPVAK